MDDSIKVAFQKVKQDIDSLNSEFSQLRKIISENKIFLENLNKNIELLTLKFNLFQIGHSQKNVSDIPTDFSKNPTQIVPLSAHNTLFKPLGVKKDPFSSGNEGVPADKQTDQQTDQQTEKQSFRSFEAAFNTFSSLDLIKEEIKKKFKNLTDQEFLIFSTIYQLSETNSIDYKTLSNKLNLTESSIRDYTCRLIRKGLPIIKEKFNNKLIKLSISPSLKKLLSLSTLISFRK